MKSTILGVIAISFLFVGCGAATKYINKGVAATCKNQTLVQSQLNGTKAEKGVDWVGMCGTP